MKKRLNRAELQRILSTPVTLALLDRIPWKTGDETAFIMLASFALWPLFVLLPTLWNCGVKWALNWNNFGQGRKYLNPYYYGSFDRMIECNQGLLDKALFPLTVCLSAAVYFFLLGKALREKRSLSGMFRKNPTFVVFLALVAWMIIDIPFTNGVTDTLMHGKGLVHESFPLHLEYFLCFLPLGVFLRNPRMKLWLLRGMTVVSVILASCAFYLHGNLKASPYYYDWAPSYAAIFTNPNYYGYFLSVFVSLSAALFACAKSWRWRCFYAFALILNTFVLSYNRTRGAWVGGLCACLFLVVACRIREGKFRLWPVAALALFVSVLYLTGLINGKLMSSITTISHDVQIILTEPDSPQANFVASRRWILWKHSLNLIKQYPIFGVGFEGVHVRALTYVTNGRPHNEFMQYALFYGIPAALLYCLGCAGVYVRAFRRRSSLDAPTLAALTAAFGYLASSFWGLTVYNTAPYLFIMLGLGYVWEETANVTNGCAETQDANIAHGETETQDANVADGETETQDATVADGETESE